MSRNNKKFYLCVSKSNFYNIYTNLNNKIWKLLICKLQL